MARDSSDLNDAMAAINGLGRAAARDTRRIEASAAPFLYASPEGRRFLGLTAPRALARGEPAESCPGLGVASGAPGRDVGRRALAQCIAALESRSAPADCRCRLLAVDDVIAAPPDAFAYAPGVNARIIGDAEAAGRLLIAEEAQAPDGRGLRVLFSDAEGPVGVADLDPDGGARLGLLGSGAVYEGRREVLGWRRGRLAERLLLTGPDGARLIALIGFEPDELAAREAPLTRWPG